jgi:eukaryotic-like serine/threonine-protein kinase
MATESLVRPSATGFGRPIDLRGRRFGRYEVLSRLGGGGMADVWIARQSGRFGFTRYVALKTIRSEHAANESVRSMFLDEARLAARVRHVNVVDVLDLGEESGIVYQVMELVEGDSLTGLLARFRRKRGFTASFPIPLSLRVVVDAARGLHAAHELRDDDGRTLVLVHRDVSPQNVLVGTDGIAKISDFGIAKALALLGETTTAPDAIKGKLGYLAPEQLARRGIDRRVDVYALGIVLWEMLAGTRLFSGSDVIEVLGRAVTAKIPDIRGRVPTLDKRIARAVHRALEQDPDARFPTAAAFADELEDAAQAAQVQASTRDVAAVVSDLVREDMRRRRQALLSEAFDDTEPLPNAANGRAPDTLSAVATIEQRRSRWRSTLLVAAIAVVLVAGLGGAWVKAARRSPTTTTNVASAGAATADETRTEPIATAPDPVAVPVLPAPSSPPTGRPSTSPPVAPRAGSRPTPKPSSALPFTNNPYQR